MAITGSYSTDTGVAFNLRATYSYTQDISANTSEVTVKLYLRHNRLYASALSGSYLSVAGNKATYSKSISYSGSTEIDTLLAEKKVIVKHSSDGKGTCAIKGTFVLNGSYSGQSIGTLTLSKTLTLQTIPRSSSISVASSVNTGSSLKITISPSDSYFKHKIRFIVDDVNKHTSDFIAAGTTSYSYTIPHSWSPNKPSKTMTIRLYTYNSSGTLIATKDKSITINVPDSIIPSVSSLKATVSSGLDGKYVQGKSKVALTISASAGSGSSLTHYYYKGKNISGTSTSYTGTSNSKTSSVIQSSGTATYQVRVKDQRGRYSDWETVDIYVYPYSQPKITSIKAERCLANGTLDNNGTYAKVTVKTTHSNVDGSNTGKVALTNSKDSSSTQIISSTKASNTYTGVYSSGFDLDSAYTISATITDEYSATHTLSATLKASQRTLNIAKYGNGLAIGKLSMVENKSDTPRFECNWDATFLDDVRIKHSSSRCFEWIRTGMSDDIDNDGINETADIQGQLYISDNGGVTCRRRYSTDNSESYTMQGYWQLRNEDMYVSDPLTVTGAITTNSRFGFNGAYNDHNFNIYGQWADGANHDILVRGTDGLSLSLGWTGGDSYQTSLDIRPKQVSIRGETTVQGFRVPEIQHGNVSITPSAANTPTSKAIAFKQEFSGSPDVVASGHTSVPGTALIGVGTASRSSTGCTIWITRTNTTETTVNWIAVY